MKVKYIGNAKDIDLAGYGLINPGDVVDVPDRVGKQLIQRPDFTEVKPRKKRVRKLRPLSVREGTELRSAFKLRGGE